MFTAQPLSKARHLIPVVSDWLLTEWPDWYGTGRAGNLAADLEAFASSEYSLPIGLVALEHGIPVGFCALKADSIASHNHLHPWVGAGYVLPERRGQGIGAFLLQAIHDHANNLGYAHVYCGTSTSVSLLLRSGWNAIEEISHAGNPMTIFRSNS
jgi:GNAT superfamily N-acetyltransferase